MPIAQATGVAVAVALAEASIDVANSGSLRALQFDQASLAERGGVAAPEHRCWSNGRGT